MINCYKNRRLNKIEEKKKNQETLEKEIKINLNNPSDSDNEEEEEEKKEKVKKEEEPIKKLNNNVGYINQIKELKKKYLRMIFCNCMSLYQLKENQFIITKQKKNLMKEKEE